MSSYIDYSKAKDWILNENTFSSNYLGKCESVFYLGNGYMGLRSATEEKYINERRGLFVAGTFNKFDENEVTELPNAADVTEIDITINGESLNLNQGCIHSYCRMINFKTGELIREIEWETAKKDCVKLQFRRIVSMDDLHTIAQKVSITSLSSDIDISITTGINGRMSNSGSQHFSEGDKRFYEQKIMQYVQQTTESHIDFVFTSCINFYKEKKNFSVKPKIFMDRRKILCEYLVSIKKGETIDLEKISNVYTSRDKENQGLNLSEIQKKSLEKIQHDEKKGYEVLYTLSAEAWNKKVWSKGSVIIDSENEIDQLALRFAHYHLYAMTPAHDNRMNIAAKGLSGEGYKGHTFWDSDIFILPFFTFCDPEIARNLVLYRYLSLPGAHKKAQGNGYAGAQFPWESAWLDDGEVTPVWGAADIVTGLPTKIWSGFIEQHITSDVVYGLWQYYCVSGDESFMNAYGYELFFETALFWVSRLEWSDADTMYHINDVVGPDEYKEHANDNAFTNYMAQWNISKAIEFYELLKQEKPALFDALNGRLHLNNSYLLWKQRMPLMYIPKPNKDGIVPQDAEYLSLKNIDLTKYKNQKHVGSLFHDYNLEQVCKMQISKQADVLILFLLMENLFSLDIKKKNWDYYEPRTMHDSSLSLSTHSILANDMNEKQLAYDLFYRASTIDMGDNMKSSDDGIHSASIGGIWQCAVFGFGGVRMLNGALRVSPSLPNAWKKLNFSIIWHGQKLEITATHEYVHIVNVTNTSSIELEIYGKKYSVTKEQKVQVAYV